ETVRAEKLVNRHEMLDLWDLKHQEEQLQQSAAALKNAVELAEGQKTDSPTQPAEQELDKRELDKKIKDLTDAAARAAQVAEARLNQKARIFEEQFRQGDHSEIKRLQLRSVQLSDEIDRVSQDSHDFSLEFGQGGRVPAGARVEL